MYQTCISGDLIGLGHEQGVPVEQDHDEHPQGAGQGRQLGLDPCFFLGFPEGLFSHMLGYPCNFQWSMGKKTWML